MGNDGAPRRGRPAVAVCCDSEAPDTLARAGELAQRLALPQAECDSRAYPILLAVTDERLEVRQTDIAAGPVYVEFEAGRFGQRRALPLRREPLARAVGFRGAPLTVVDGTAGLGRDAVVLALLGCRVTAVEAEPVVAELLEDGLRRARRDPALAEALRGLRVVRGDAVAFVASLPAADRPDVIYLDPMFPERTGSALAKKELALLARLVGPGEDAGPLLQAARATGCRRVVLKRPRHAPEIVAAGLRPALRVETRAARFDVYLPRASVTPASSG